MLKLTITKDSREVGAVELGPGSHLVGRAESCAVVLPGQDVSSTHACIEVGSREVVVKDMESLNGVFRKGEKIGKASFTSDVEFEIAGYSLKGRFRPDKAKKSMPRLEPPPVRILVPAALLAAAFGTLIVFWLAGASSIRDTVKRESLRRGVLLARSLAELNASPMRAKLAGHIRVTPITAEDGVRYAFVADQAGKVLAPSQAVGKVLDNPKVAEAVKQGQTTLYEGGADETVFVSPIKDAEGVMGVAVISYSPESGLAGPSLSGAALWSVCAALALALAGTWLVLKSIFRPIEALTEQVGMALKTGGHDLDLRRIDPSFTGLAKSVERVLTLSRDLEGVTKEHPAPAEPKPPVQAPDVPARDEPGLDRQQGPCFQLDLSDYRILAWNEAFGPLAAPGARPPVHLLRGLADADALTAVLNLLEAPDSPGERPLEGTCSNVSKTAPDSQGCVLFLFKERRDG